jgi:hypothetical protein
LVNIALNSSSSWSFQCLPLDRACNKTSATSSETTPKLWYLEFALEAIIVEVERLPGAIQVGLNIPNVITGAKNAENGEPYTDLYAKLHRGDEEKEEKRM